MSIFISLNICNAVVILFHSELSITQFHSSGCFKQSQHAQGSSLLSEILPTPFPVPIKKGEAALIIFHLSPPSDFLFCFWRSCRMWANLYGVFGSVTSLQIYVFLKQVRPLFVTQIQAEWLKKKAKREGDRWVWRCIHTGKSENRREASLGAVTTSPTLAGCFNPPKVAEFQNHLTGALPEIWCEAGIVEIFLASHRIWFLLSAAYASLSTAPRVDGTVIMAISIINDSSYDNKSRPSHWLWCQQEKREVFICFKWKQMHMGRASIKQNSRMVVFVLGVPSFPTSSSIRQLFPQ